MTMSGPVKHQYVRRHSGQVVTEDLFADRIVGFLYSTARERAPTLFRALTGQTASHLLGLANFDLPLARPLTGSVRFLERNGVDLAECIEPPESFTTPRRVFERQIRYWQCRPMPGPGDTAVSPADSRAVIGSFDQDTGLFAKGKFFDYEELFGPHKGAWLSAFEGGDFAVFRLTPDKYHYNHTPVAGKVVDYYEIAGSYHSCNPGAVVEMATPYSKNRRAVTVVDSDVEGGTGVGLVALIEIAALMIGGIVQCYSARAYENPRPVEPGLFVERGRPKSLYRPGSSTDVVVFQKERVEFASDLVENLRNRQATSRFSVGFGGDLVETELKVRSLLATKRYHA